MSKNFGFWQFLKSLIFKSKPDDFIYAGTPDGTIHRLYLNDILIPNVYIWDKKNKVAWISLNDGQGRVFLDDNNKLILGSYYLPDAVLRRADDEPLSSSLI